MVPCGSDRGFIWQNYKAGVPVSYSRSKTGKVMAIPLSVMRKRPRPPACGSIIWRICRIPVETEKETNRTKQLEWLEYSAHITLDQPWLSATSFSSNSSIWAKICNDLTPGQKSASPPSFGPPASAQVALQHGRTFNVAVWHLRLGQTQREGSPSFSRASLGGTSAYLSAEVRPP